MGTRMVGTENVTNNAANGIYDIIYKTMEIHLRNIHTQQR